MALSDNRRLGAVSATGAVIGDVILNSGEVLLSLLAYVLTSPDILVSAVLYAQRLAGMVGWLPQAQMQNLAVIGIVLLIVVYLRRWIIDWRNA